MFKSSFEKDDLNMLLGAIQITRDTIFVYFRNLDPLGPSP